MNPDKPVLLVLQRVCGRSFPFYPHPSGGLFHFSSSYTADSAAIGMQREIILHPVSEFLILSPGGVCAAARWQKPAKKFAHLSLGGASADESNSYVETTCV